MSKSRIFIAVAVSFAAGVLTASAWTLSHPWVFATLAAAAAIFSFSFIIGQKAPALLALFLFCAGLGSWRLNAAAVENEYGSFMGIKQQFEGYIVSEPDVRDVRQMLYVRPKGLSQNLLVTATLAQSFFYGDEVALEGKVKEIQNFDDFDYRGYLERHNVYAQMSYPKILILKNSRLNPLKFAVLKLKAALVARLGSLYREPENSLLLGILIGARKSLPKDIVENFNLTGTSHIIAVSGFNITIMITALAALARFLGRRFGFWLTTGVIITFVILTGASASVIRAGIMGFLLLLSLNIGRQYAVVPALFFAGLIMLVINPKILFWDVGFQLSFAATMGIVFLYPPLNLLASRWPEALGTKTMLLTTLSAIAATLPLVLLNFARLSAVAPLVNMLVLPVVPFAMLFGFLSLLPLAGPGLAFLAVGLLRYILLVTEWFARLPHASLDWQISPRLFWLMSTAVLGGYFWLRKTAEKVNREPLG